MTKVHSVPMCDWVIMPANTRQAEPAAWCILPYTHDGDHEWTYDSAIADAVQSQCWVSA